MAKKQLKRERRTKTPHCPEHGKELKVYQARPGKKMRGRCPEGHELARNEWVAR
jgi:hypothetical protein